MTIDTDAVRRGTRIISALRARSLKVRRQDPAAAALGDLLDESLDACNGFLQELAAVHLECDKLRHELQTERATREHLLERMPMSCLATDRTGLIEYANQPASELFNVSAKHLRGRQLLHFATDRAAFGQVLETLPIDGQHVVVSVPIRPRERGQAKVHALIIPETPVSPSSWLWFLTPAAAAAR